VGCKMVSVALLLSARACESRRGEALKEGWRELEAQVAHLEQQRESAENVLDDLESELDNLDSALQSARVAPARMRRRRWSRPYRTRPLRTDGKR